MSIEMLKTIAQNSPAAMALVRGSDFRFEFVNPAYAALAAGEPMVGRTVAEVWPATSFMLDERMVKQRDKEAREKFLDWSAEL